MKAIKLYDYDTMLARLLAVNDVPHFKERFYPKLLKMADTELNAIGIVIGIRLSAHDYCMGLPLAIRNFIDISIPEYIDAMCPDSKVAEEAKKFLTKA